MSSLPRFAILLGLALGCVSTVAGSQTSTQKKAQKATVSGRVTIREKGAPGIAVALRNSDYSPQPAPALKATTDQDGNYRITDISAGNYQVSPVAPVYTISDLDSPRARGKTLLIAEGEDVEGIDFSLVLGGVITGKVTDVDGRPIIEERVTLVPAEQANARDQRGPVVFGFFQTDDRGIYRIYGIPPGRYRISVGVADEELSSSIRIGRVAYKRTFYPDATEFNDAKIVEVLEGTEATGVDIIIGRSLPGFAASGRAVDGETGQPVMGLRLGLRRVVNGREGPVIGLFTTSNSRGEFRVENVTPGRYVLFMAPQPGSEVRADTVPFQVIDQDVPGLLLKTSKGFTIAGSLALDGTYDKNVFAKLVQLRLQAYVRDENGSNSWQESSINPDGSFLLSGLAPGSAHFSLTAQDRRPPVGFRILRVERDGVIQPRGIEIKPGEQATGVKILMGYGTGSIRGEVKIENGPLPQDARIVVWIKKLGDAQTNSRPYNLDARGHFLIEGVAAGSYELNVNANAAGRRLLQSSKQQIEVAEGSVTKVVVVLDLKSDPRLPQ